MPPWWCGGNANILRSGLFPKALPRMTTATGWRIFQTRNRIRKWFTRNARLCNLSTRSWESLNPCFDRHSRWLITTTYQEQKLAPCSAFHLGRSRVGSFMQDASSWIGRSGLWSLPFAERSSHRPNHGNVRDSGACKYLSHDHRQGEPKTLHLRGSYEPHGHLRRAPTEFRKAPSFGSYFSNRDSWSPCRTMASHVERLDGSSDDIVPAVRALSRK